ncbi:MAG TPA: zf-HC2 domain-containing protein [Solirubrobacterales bacterium]|nr:zf-HC2 domain-containing protein [Solirubrobacterales bacterium]
MTDGPGCERVRELAPELALGIADGEERAEALEHLARCPDCRRYLSELSASADELLLLAPSHEPPAGFEQRVRAQIVPRRGRRWRRALAPVAAAAAAALVAAAGVWMATDSDRELADRYAETLATANGDYFAAAPLEGAGGRRLGTVFGYEGNPSWCMVVIEPGEGAPLPSGTYEMQLVTEDGRRIPWGALEVEDGTGSAGHAMELDYHELAEMRLVDSSNEEVAEAEL